MTQYTAISYTLSGDKIERRDFRCRKQATAFGCIADFEQVPQLVKLMGRTTSWYIDGRWYASHLAASRKLDAIGYHPAAGR